MKHWNKKAIGSRSLIKALEMKRDSLREQYRNMIREKKIEYERFVLVAFSFTCYQNEIKTFPYDSYI